MVVYVNDKYWCGLVCPRYGGKMMVVKQRWFQLLALMLILSLALTACEMPLPGSGNTDTPAETDPLATPDANVGGGEPPTNDAVDEPATEPETAPDPNDGETPRLDEATATPEPEPETAETTDEDATNDAATTDGAATESETEAETPAESPAPATPQTHTVAVGENLYRIGLKYGVSWVTLASYNNLPNADAIKVGQILNIPSGGGLEVEPTPSPLTETTYVVQAGDNLFRIGLKYGIAWTQIAEANGILNPSQLKVGQELKIPVDAPDPAPQTTHLVKSGETLFLISLQYGMAWTAVAEANNLSSPYVIYPGQTLVIPGE